MSKPRTVQEIQKAIKKQHIWRGDRAVDESFATGLRTTFSWSQTPRTRLLLFLRSSGFHVTGEQVTVDKRAAVDAIECVHRCGTTVRLLEAYYRQLGVKLVLMNGARCAQIWEPDDWASRGPDNKVTVVLNVWNDHVSTYTTDVGDEVPEETGLPWPQVCLITARADDDEHRYDEMKELDWCELLEAWQEKHKGTVFWITGPLEDLEKDLHSNGLAFVPHYTAPGKCNLSTCLSRTAAMRAAPLARCAAPSASKECPRIIGSKENLSAHAR